MGTSYPFACSSAIAPSSCGIDADTFGSLTMFASFVFASSPSSPSSSRCRCSGDSRSGNAAMIRPDTEMSESSTESPAGSVKRLTTGSSANVASAGASSVYVQTIFDVDARRRAPASWPRREARTAHRCILMAAI